MIRRAIVQASIARRHVRLIAQDKKPSKYFKFNKEHAEEIYKSSGKYSKNPAIRAYRWIKEFIFYIKAEREFLKANPPQKPII